jgi:hypothetical protein
MFCLLGRCLHGLYGDSCDGRRYTPVEKYTILALRKNSNICSRHNDDDDLCRRSTSDEPPHVHDAGTNAVTVGDMYSIAHHKGMFHSPRTGRYRRIMPGYIYLYLIIFLSQYGICKGSLLGRFHRRNREPLLGMYVMVLSFDLDSVVPFPFPDGKNICCFTAWDRICILDGMGGVYRDRQLRPLIAASHGVAGHTSVLFARYAMDGMVLNRMLYPVLNSSCCLYYSPTSWGE